MASISRTFREALLLNLSLDRVPDEAPITDLTVVAELWKKIFEDGTAIESLDNVTKAPNEDESDTPLSMADGNSVLVIKQMEIDGKREKITILFNLVDPDIADNTYTNIKTGNMRDAERRANEAPTVSAHLVICMVKRSRTLVQYRAALEHVAGINRGRIETFLNRLLRRAVKDNPEFEFVATDEANGKNGKSQRSIIPK